MEITELKKKIVGKKLMTIIRLDTGEYIQNKLKVITGVYEDDLFSAHLLVFENGVELVYSDFEEDGYRSGPWDLSILDEVLDKGFTKEIKNINSVVRDVIFLDVDCREYFMITTDEYVILLGQDYSDSYYPCNFFDVKETQEHAINDIKGENTEKN